MEALATDAGRYSLYCCLKLNEAFNDLFTKNLLTWCFFRGRDEVCSGSLTPRFPLKIITQNEQFRKCSTHYKEILCTLVDTGTLPDNY